MKRVASGKWPLLFFLLVLLYAVYYAPYGINETDGGFLTGLAWQVLQGKILYQDLVYIRPPLPVWLRALELQALPSSWAILGERWIFYLKVAAYSWLAAAVLAKGRDRWRLATFGFVVSAHCYPAAAWHSVDGILCAVLSAWCLFNKPGFWGSMLAGVTLFTALLCKQSFYPLAFFGLAAAWFLAQRGRAVVGLLTGFLLGTVLFFSYLYKNGLIAGFLRMTNGAASSGQALQHGVLDYFHIQPGLAGLSVVLLLVAWLWRDKYANVAYAAWMTWLAALIGSYAFAIWQRQDFTAPFAQARLLFWLACGFLVFQIIQRLNTKHQIPNTKHIVSALFLLAIAWCAAVSWGYNLPILLATPGVWAVLEINRRLYERMAAKFTGQRIRQVASRWGSALALVALLAVFRWGYEFVYRDGRRSAMTEDLGCIFPALRGIRSDLETATRYGELKMLTNRYGPHCKTLPAFPQANFLTNTLPPLPLDWVASREMNADSTLVMNALKRAQPVLLIEKSYLSAIETDPELALVRSVFHSATRLGETTNFLVMRPATPKEE